MSRYTDHNPLVEDAAREDGTRTGEVTRLGKDVQYLASPGERLPAFVGLAKATGGYYAENENGMTLPDAMRAARMNYKVEFQDDIHVTELTPRGTVTTTYPHRGTRAFWDDDPDNPVGLGMVKSRYQVFQPAQAGEFAQSVLNKWDANVVAAGIYGDPVGAKSYIALKLPEGMTVGGQDPHDVYFTVLNSYDGSGAMIALLAPLRQRCTNMTTATFGRLANRVKIRHSGDMTVKTGEVERVLGLGRQWMEQWSARAEQLLATPLSGADLDAYLMKVLPTPETVSTRAGAANWEAKRLEIKQIITRSETCEFGRGRAYAGVQGVHEWADWMSPTKAEGVDGLLSRYTRTIDGADTEKVKLRAVSLALA